MIAAEEGGRVARDLEKLGCWERAGFSLERAFSPRGSAVLPIRSGFSPVPAAAFLPVLLSAPCP